MTRIILGLLVMLSATGFLTTPFSTVFSTTVFSTAVANAQTNDESDVINLMPGLDIEARIGLGMLSSSEGPAAITAFIRNNTNKTIEGRLQISDRWRGSRLNLGEIYLAPGQVRRFCSIKNFEGWGNPVLALVSNGKPVWQQPLLWSGYSNSDQRGTHGVGILHDGGTDHQFRMELPVTSTVEMLTANRGYDWQDTITLEFTEAGYQVATSNIKTWQIPDHFGPLEPVRAIVALDSVDPDKLNAAQKTAIANWITTGGAFYLPVQSEELLQEIERSLPFAISPATVKNTLAIRRCGLGQIVLYPDALFGDSTSSAEETIYRSIAALPKEAVRSAASAELLKRPESYGRNATRVSIMGYFFGYLILSVVPIVFVTTKLKRKVIPYTVGLVGIGCLAAAVLGATLRNSTGESRWITLTVPGDNGSVQFADIEVRSTGGIGSTVCVSGKRPDLQAESPSPRNYYYSQARNNSGMAFEGFNWRANEVEAKDRYQLQSEITPWGTRRLRATDFDSEITAPDVQLTLNGKSKNDYSNSSIRVLHTGAYAVKNLRLTLHVSSQDRNGTTPLQAVASLSDLTPNQELQQPLLLNPGQLPAEINLGMELFEFILPTSTAPNTVRAFLIGTLDKSLGLNFEDAESDFALDHGAHLWIYEIPAEQIQMDHP